MPSSILNIMLKDEVKISEIKKETKSKEIGYTCQKNKNSNMQAI